MAEAGFFYTGTSDDDDSAACFVCGKLLDGWENEDEPWKEHEKHAPNCHFVKMHLIEDDLTVSYSIASPDTLLKHSFRSNNSSISALTSSRAMQARSSTRS